jgi:hypothetical protein
MTRNDPRKKTRAATGTCPNSSSKSAQTEGPKPQTWLAKYLEELAATIDDGPALTVSLTTGRDLWRLPANLRKAAQRRHQAGDRPDTRRDPSKR